MPKSLFVALTFLGLSLSLGCSSSENGGSGGVPAAGGSGGTGASGGSGGTGGMGGGPRTCLGPRDCDDGEPCTMDLCVQQICAYEPLRDQTQCVTDLGISACLAGECQSIWDDCMDEAASDGDFCRPNPAPEPNRLGRCSAGACTVEPCEVGLDCWNGETCQVGVCESNQCSTENAPDGTGCIPPAFGQCSAGACVPGGTGGTGGGAGGAGGSGGASGQGGAGGGV